MKITTTPISFVGKILLIFLLLPSSKGFSQNCSVNAGVGYSVCPGNVFILDGNASGTFAGNTVQWSIVSQPGSVSIINPLQLSTTTTAATIAGNYVFKLQITCGDTSIISQNVTYTVSGGASAPGAISTTAIGNPYCIATNGTSAITFSGNAAVPANTTETWSYSSDVYSGSFDNTSSDNPVFTIGAVDPYKCPTTGSIIFTRTFTSTISGCQSSVSKTISNITATIPVFSYVSLCSGISLTGTCPGAGTGTWSVVSTMPSTGVTFSSTTNNFSTVTNPVVGTAYVIRYTVAGSGCTNGTNDVSFTYSPSTSGPATTANAGPDQTFSTAMPSSITLNGNQPGTGESGM